VRNYIDFWEQSVWLVQDPNFGDFTTVVSMCLSEKDELAELLTALLALNTGDYFGMPQIYGIVNPTVTWNEPRLFYVKLDSADVVIRMMCGFLSDCINDDARAAGASIITQPNALAQFGLDLATLKLQIVSESPR